jgi:hypothetical protein
MPVYGPGQALKFATAVSGPAFAIKLIGQTFTRRPTMRRYLMAALLVASMSSIPMIAGCDRTVHESEKTTSGPNGQSTAVEKTVQHPDGSVTTEKKSSNSNTPPNP